MYKQRQIKLQLEVVFKSYIKVTTVKVTISPLLGDSSIRSIPEWFEIVEPAREKSLFWHNIWMECGRPKMGVVADIMQPTRLYHYSIRKVKWREKDIVVVRFAETILNNRSVTFGLKLNECVVKAL